MKPKPIEYITPLISLKTFQQISGLAYRTGYKSTRTVFEMILGEVPDISNVSEVTAQKIISYLEHKVEQNKKDKNYVPPKAVEPKGNKSRYKVESTRKVLVMDDE